MRVNFGSWNRILRIALGVGLLAMVWVVTLGAQGGGRGRMAGRGMDETAQADMQVFQQLIEQRAKIVRTVTPRPDGIESVTESEDPAVARLIRTHVAAMSARVKEARPIHQRDPLFAEVFKHASLIEMQSEHTAKGIRVIETSRDAYVVKLIQAHADVVSLFLRNGHAEMMKNHAVPARGKTSGRGVTR
jgi:hypothetical protein